MKKRFRSVLFLMSLVVATAVVVVVTVGLFADGAVRVAVESAGTKALGVGVNVEEADLSIMTGSVALRDIAVTNPPGYERENLLDIRRADILVDTRSLLSEEVHIKDMKLNGMELFIEQKGVSTNNLHEVIKASRRDDATSGKRLIIEKLDITDITVNVELLPIPGRADAATFQLTPIQMTDLGRQEKLDLGILYSKILLAVAAGVAEQGGDVLPKEMIGDLTVILNTTIDIGRIIFGNQGTDASSKDGAKKIGDAIGQGLKNLLDSKDKQ